MTHTSKLASALLVLLAVGVAGCGKKIDGPKLEEAIKTGIHDQVKGAEVKSMSCPTDVEAKAGGTFECKGEDKDGTQLVVAVKITDDDGKVSWEIKSAKKPGGDTAPAATH